MRGRRPVPALRRPASPRASREARSSAAEGGGLRRRAASSVAGGGGERGAAVSRPPPGPAPEGRWDELSSGECASLGAKGGGGGAPLTGPIVGVVLAMMSWAAACRGRPPARSGGRPEPRFSPRRWVGRWVRGEPQVGSGEMLGWLRPRGRQALGRAGVSGSERGGGVLAGCPAELARGWLAANKAALMETCCCTKAEHSGSFLSVWGGFFFFPLFPPRAAFLYAAWLGGHLHHGPAAASGDLLGSEQPSPK